jgi:hypothetical protein
MAIPPKDILITEWLAELCEAAEQDLPAARQAALLRIIWQESYLTRRGLIARVEAILGRGCFGSSPHRAFRRDIAVVRQVLADAGHILSFNRRRDQKGYYVEGRPLLDERLQRLIAGAVAEVDPQQIAIYQRLGPAQRVWQAGHLSNWLRRANERRLQRREAA